jgi:hypothetical protein
MAYNPNNTVDQTAGQARPPKPTALRIIPDPIPPELKALSQWVVWRYFWKDGKNGKPGKWDKPLLNSHTGNAASHSSAKTWSAYQAALDAYHFDGANLDGIGFVFQKDNGLVGIDLDDCRDPITGVIEDWALEAIRLFDTYTEISTSGTGVHLICKGTLPGQGVKTKHAEMYNHVRYFCVTGNVLEGTPGTIETPDPAVITDIYQRLRATQAGRNQRAQPSNNGTSPSPTLDDDTIIQKALGARNSQKFATLWAGEFGDYPSQSEADQALCRALVFWTEDPEQIDRIFRRSGLMRNKWNEHPTYAKWTITKAIETPHDRYQGVSATRNGQPHHADVVTDVPSDDQCNASSNSDQERKSNKPIIKLSTNMTSVVYRTEINIRDHPKGPFLYQRAHQLSVITRGATPPKWLNRAPDAPLIHPADKALIRELAAFCAEWRKWDAKKKEEVKTLPPPWAIETLMARPRWSFPPLEGIICAPTLRPDGSILDRPGYDCDTGLYLSLDQVQFPPIPDHPTIDDARLCVEILLEVFVDFPFLEKSYKAAALAALLSLVVRFTIQGLVPFFAVRSTTRGAGKGLLIDVICMIATGRRAPRWAQTLDEEEERKRLMTIAMSGDAALHIDNITHPLGSGPLDMAMTAEAITDRIMATHAERTAPIKAVFFGSGNNMVFQSDMARRVVPIDLAPQQERPDEREDFTHHPLLPWVLQQRPRLVMAALTIVKAYIDAKQPKQDGIKPFGSYEEWSDLIRQSLIWAGQPDPCAGRGDIEAESDPKYEMQRVVLSAWHDCYKELAKTLQEVKDDIDNHTTREMEEGDDGKLRPTGKWLVDPAYRDLQSALLTLDKHGKSIDLRAIGYAFRGWRGRVLADLRLEKAGEDRLGIIQWRVKKLNG